MKAKSVLSDVRMAVVGAGYFGSYHCEKMDHLEGVDLVAVVDLDAAQAQRTAARFGIEAMTDCSRLSGRVDAAVVAVPAEKHHAVATALLGDGIDLLIEKPMATSLKDAEELCRLADQRSACLQVGHLERFNPIMPEVLARVDKPGFIRMERLGPCPGRGLETGVVFEVMTHDLDILLQIASGELLSISACGWKVQSSSLDVASARLKFSGGLMAEIYASRVSDRQVREFSVLGGHGLLEVNLAKRSLSHTVFENGKHRCERIDRASADVLLAQDRSFVEVLHNGRKPLVNGLAGRSAVELAEQIMAAINPAQVGPPPADWSG
jgi:predicted dehydrogenase